jgi:hypothetical protein
MSYFTIEDIENILFNGIQYELSSDILERIRQIESELHLTITNEPEASSSSSSVDKNNNYSNHRTQDTYSHSSHHKRGGGGGAGGTDRERDSYDKKKGQYHKKTVDGTKHSGKHFMNKNITNNDWEILRNFTSTKITVNEGVDKNINEIRILLNKISDKNYDVYSEKVIHSVSDFLSSTKDAESIMKLSNAIFEIISKNKYFSELYAKLYVRLIEISSIFSDILNRYIFHFKEKIHSIQYVDPDKDYDGFCENTKVNDIRKSSLTFIMNLYKLNIVDIEKIHEMTYFLLNLTLTYIDEADKSNIVEEITENLFIIISMGITQFLENEIWKSTIYPIIIKISAMKAKEHVSLTNRTVFKYMDIIDSIE